MTTWQTENPITWYQKLYWAIWNSVVAFWDDQTVTWDAIGDHDWKTKNTRSWYVKN